MLLLFAAVTSIGWAAEVSEIYTFTSKAWATSQDAWTSNGDGGQLTSGQGVQITKTISTAGCTSKKSFSNVSKIIVRYCTNASNGVGSIKVKVGEGTEKSFSVTKPSSGGTTLKNAEFTFDPAETGNVTLTATCTTNSVYINSITIFYNEEGGSTTESPLASIALSGDYPTIFAQGDAFSHAGMTVTATYEDETTKDVTSSAEFTGYEMNTIGEQTVTVSYTEGEVTKTTTYNITVNAPALLTSIALSGDYPTTFYQNDAFSYAGAVVTATYEDNSTKDVTSSATFSTPDMTTTGTKEVTVSYTENEITKTTSYEITVNADVTPANQKKDAITSSDLAATSSTYISFSDVAKNSNARYAGNTAKHSSNAIQLRTTNNNSGIVSTTSGGKLISVSVTWNSSTTAGRTLNIYGSNTEYTAASDLYDSSKQGTLIGTLTATGTVTVPATDTYTYVGIRSSSGAMYIDDVTFVWEESSKQTATVTIGTNELTVGNNTVVTTDGPALTLTSNNTNVATVSGTTVTGAAAGYATITAAWDENDDFDGGTNTFDVTVKDADKGTEANPYTVAEALALIDNLGTKASWDVYVSGVVSRTTQYNSGGTITYYIYDAEGGEELQVYKGNGIDNAAFSAMTDLQPGDEVTVFGKLKLYNNSTKEFDSGNYLVAFNRPNPKAEAGLSFPEASYQATVGETFTAPTLTNPNNLTVTYTSNNAEVATVDENTGAVTIVAAGTAKITASSAETEDYYAGTASYTLNVKNPPATLVTVDADGNTTFDLTQNDWGFPEGSANKAVEEGSFSNSGYTIKVAGSNNNGYYYNTGYLMIGKAGAYLTFPAFDYDVDKIEVVGRSGASTSVKQNIYVGETAVSTETTGCTKTNTYEIAEDYQAAGNVYTLKLTSAHNAQITSIIVYKKAATPTVVDLTLDENDDNSAVLTANDGKVANVTIGRTFSNASFSTIVLPFDVDNTTLKNKFGNNTKLYSFDGDIATADDKLELQFNAETAIEAGKPYLIMPETATTNPVFEGVTISSNVISALGTNATFIPNLNATTIAASQQVMFLGAANTLYFNSETATMKGFRAYWQLTRSFTGASIPFDDAVTGIKTIDNESLTTDNDGWYTINGVRLHAAPAQKGVYIHNGKKVVVK